MDKTQLMQLTLNAISGNDVYNVASLLIGYGDVWKTCTPYELSLINGPFKNFVQTHDFANSIFVQSNLYKRQDFGTLVNEIPFSIINLGITDRYYTPLHMQTPPNVLGYPDIIEIHRVTGQILGIECKNINSFKTFKPLSYNSTYNFITSEKNYIFYNAHKNTSFVTTYNQIRGNGFHDINYLKNNNWGLYQKHHMNFTFNKFNTMHNIKPFIPK